MSTTKKLSIALPLMILAALLGIFLWSATEHADLEFAETVGAQPQIPIPKTVLLPTVNVPKAVGWRTSEKPVATAGLSVAPFTEGLDHPRWLYVLPNGDVLVSESNSPQRKGGGIKGLVMRAMMKRGGAGVASPNRISLLRDADGDGKAELRTVLMSGLNSPSGLAWADGQLYIGNTDALIRVPFTPGQTKISATPVVVARYPGGGNHWARNLLLTRDGKSILVAIGSASNIGENGLEQEEGRARVIEVQLSTGQIRVFAYGLRNPNGLAVEPSSGDIWTTVNERDMMGSDTPPDYLAELQLGGFYGWPWYYWGGLIDKRVEEPAEDMRPYVIRPDYSLGPHVAALGLTFTKGAALGRRFSGGAIIARHGSWNRRPLSGYDVVFVPFVAGRPKGKPIAILGGFLSPNEEIRGRPVSVAIGRDGGLLISDDVGGKIWRVSAATR